VIYYKQIKNFFHLKFPDRRVIINEEKSDFLIKVIRGVEKEDYDIIEAD